MSEGAHRLYRRQRRLDQREATLRQRIAALEAREAELLTTLTTLEVAIAAMREWLHVHDPAGRVPVITGETP